MNSGEKIKQQQSSLISRKRITKLIERHHQKRGTSGKASIHTAEMTAMKKIEEREDIRWVIYTDSLSSMLAIENNRENYPILIRYMTH